jgi:hypothetical protein
MLMLAGGAEEMVADKLVEPGRVAVGFVGE